VTRFSDVHALGYNSTGSERILMQFRELRVYCLELALIRAEARAEEFAKVFLSGKQRTTLPISG